MNREQSIEHALSVFDMRFHQLELFRRAVVGFFEIHPQLTGGSLPIIHSIKSRIKDRGHLKDKLIRKWDDGREIDGANLFTEITDLIGVRIIHLYQQQFSAIHAAIMNQVEQTEWYFVEKPKAYTWDPEATHYYINMGLDCRQKESYYTSIHYLVKPRLESDIVCEIQVRTLFEEIWGEIDHYINYPYPTSSLACSEQLRVMGKLVSTGTRLADAIIASLNEYNEKTTKESSEIR